MKSIFKLGMLLFVAASLFATTSCTKEFEVQPDQLYGTWYFPANLPVDTLTGFNWAGAEMIIKAPDTIWVNYEPGKTFLWTLRGNNVTATCTPRSNVDEHYVIAFTVYEATKKSLKIEGKYRYLYNGDNMERGKLSCTLVNTPTITPEE
jgi:hypothetical protein